MKKLFKDISSEEIIIMAFFTIVIFLLTVSALLSIIRYGLIL